MSLALLNSDSLEARLQHLREMVLAQRAGAAVPRTEEVNNHIHTMYSFSPYSPSAAAWQAAQAGLQAAGIMDHDSIAGANEMLEACKIIGIGSTAGFELRVDCSMTGLSGRKINNPDSLSIAYMAIHGIPRPAIPEVARFLEPIQKARNLRNRAMVACLNEHLQELGVPQIDFERDVFARSLAAQGGAITERHILAALAEKLIGLYGRDGRVVGFLRDTLKVELPAKMVAVLSDSANPHYLYDLLGILKSSFLPSFFIQPGSHECIPVRKAVKFALHIGAIPAYAYLGDVTASPTGDKKAEKFEDDYLDLLFDELVALGFRAVTYMPPRNTLTQLQRVQGLCVRHGLMEISGVDINSSRQSFSCPEIMQPVFRHLIAATWALIAHEKLASLDARFSLFHPANPYATDPLAERLQVYAKVGASLDSAHPENALKMAVQLFPGKFEI
ncbi:MAG: PHP domain-containing protein [bacterium]